MTLHKLLAGKTSANYLDAKAVLALLQIKEKDLNDMYFANE